MKETMDLAQDWTSFRTEIMRVYPDFYELEPGGAIVMNLGTSGWMLELQPVARLLCQVGVDSGRAPHVTIREHG